MTTEERVDARLTREADALEQRIAAEDARADSAGRDWERQFKKAVSYKDDERVAAELQRAEAAQETVIGARANARRLREKLALVLSDGERRRQTEKYEHLEEVRETAKKNGHVPTPRPRKTSRGANTPAGPKGEAELALFALSRGDLRALASANDIGVSGHKITLVRRLLDAGVTA